MHGFQARTIKALRRRGQHYRKHHKRFFRDGRCAAVLRALTAAQLYRNKQVPTLAGAAEGCGSNVTYVRAAFVMLQAENLTIINRVLHGAQPLRAAAREVAALARLVAAYRASNTTTRSTFGRMIGPTELFDAAVAPAL